MIREALLSLLAKGPSYGYQLKVEFEDATGEAWPLNVGQVYTTLGRMERDEAVNALGEDEEGRPQYEITRQGKLELENWLSQPLIRDTGNRDELSMKILMAVATEIIDPSKTIAIQRQTSMQKLQEATIQRRNSGTIAETLHIERLILNLKAELNWLDIAEERLSKQNKASNK